MNVYINNLLVKLSWNPAVRQILVPCRNFHCSTVSNLYSSAAIGIDNYLMTRKKVQEQFINFSDKFRVKMNEFVSDPKNLIFTEDLKNMVHLAEYSDLGLVNNMITKFNSQTSEFRFGSFIFGPVIMRMFHYLNAPQEALLCFNDPVNDGFFDQLVSYQILLDLLYNNEMYQDMYNVFEKVKVKQINMMKYPKYSVVLIMAACYKQNTPQSFEYASKLWTDMAVTGTVPLRRSATYFAGLALKQGAPHVALESISMQRQHYVTIRNIKAVALAQMGRFEEIIPLLRQVLDVDKPEQKDKHTFFAETVAKVRTEIEKADNKDLLKEFQDVERALSDRGLIDVQTLDNLLNHEISISTKTEQPRGMPSRLSGGKKMPYGLRNRTPLS